MFSFRLAAQDSLKAADSSLVTVRYNELHPDYNANSIAEFLQGRVAGLHIVPYTGEPGSATTLDIRGITSISNSNYPLIVIDGQLLITSPTHTVAADDTRPSDALGGMNLNDIETIEILKDALATGAYGAMGGNGVIKITTKSGKGTGKIRYHNRLDWSNLPKQLPMLKSEEFMLYINEARQNSGEEPLYTASQINTLSSGSINWQDRAFENAFSHSHYLSLSGRNTKSNYHISGNYSDLDGLTNRSDYLLGGLRVNADHAVSSKFKLGLRSYYSSTQRVPVGYSGAATDENNFAPLFAQINSPLGQNDIFQPEHPELIPYLVKYDSKLSTLIGNLHATYQFNEKWAYTFLYGISRFSAREEKIRATLTGSAFLDDSRKNNSSTIFNELSYRESRNEHTFDIAAGYTRLVWKNVINTSLGLDGSAVSSSYSKREAGLDALKGRFGYDYAQRYAFTLTGSYEGMSRYAGTSKWKFFPSAALSWTISNEENFNRQVISLLRLRSGYGISGTEHTISASSTTGLPTFYYYPFGTVIDPGYVFSNNLNWKPPTVKSFNAGADVGLAGNKLNFSVDYYKKDVNNLLMHYTAPGGEFYYINQGKISNSGFEISGNYLLNKPNWSLSVGSNITFMKNRLHLPDGVGFAGQGIASPYGYFVGNQSLQIAQSGFPVSAFWTYKTDGIYQTDEEVATGPEAPTARPGDIRWVDVNKDGEITAADKTIAGNPYPDFVYGLNASLNYKKFSFAVSVIGSSGNELLNLNKWATHTNNAYGHYNTSQAAYSNRWTGPGTSNVYPRPTYRYTPPVNQRVPEWAVEDASFVRLQSVSAGYTFNFASGAKSRKLRMYLSATNLFTLTNYSGYDPAIDTQAEYVISRGIDWGTLPQPRTLSAGLELNL